MLNELINEQNRSVKGLPMGQVQKNYTDNWGFRKGLPHCYLFVAGQKLKKRKNSSLLLWQLVNVEDSQETELYSLQSTIIIIMASMYCNAYCVPGAALNSPRV